MPATLQTIGTSFDLTRTSGGDRIKVVTDTDRIIFVILADQTAAPGGRVRVELDGQFARRRQDAAGPEFASNGLAAVLQYHDDLMVGPLNLGVIHEVWYNDVQVVSTPMLPHRP